MRMMHNPQQSMRTRRRRRVRAKIYGTAQRPRLSLFRSHRYLYAQLIDDAHGRTLLALHEGTTAATGTKTEHAAKAGEEFGRRAKAAHMSAAVFDRNGYAYHGRVKAFAQGVRKSGLLM